jgi:hypothetical protein
LSVQEIRIEVIIAAMNNDGRYTFTKWLLQYQRDATAVGDLARQVARDAEWTDPPSLGALESQLSGAGSPQATLDIARRAWRRYAAETKPRTKA